MELECIISLANRAVEIRFRAMVRSLRSLGCDLPVLVIPYNEDIFQLPEGCEYWREENLFTWLSRYPAHHVKRKYAVLTKSNYQFVDADVIFLKNPQEVLRPLSGFVTCCGHWRDPAHVSTPQLVDMMRRKTPHWQKLIFNSGQFACDRALFSCEELQRESERPEFRSTVLEHRFHEQPGLNQLVLSREIEYTNLTLPPFNFASSWAGDYPAGYTATQNETSPYLMHWAGMPRGKTSPIDQLYLEFLSRSECEQLQQEEERSSQSKQGLFSRVRQRLTRALCSREAK